MQTVVINNCSNVFNTLFINKAVVNLVESFGDLYKYILMCIIKFCSDKNLGKKCRKRSMFNFLSAVYIHDCKRSGCAGNAFHVSLHKEFSEDKMNYKVQPKIMVSENGFAMLIKS